MVPATSTGVFGGGSGVWRESVEAEVGGEVFFGTS